jgi:cyanate permease
MGLVALCGPWLLAGVGAVRGIARAFILLFACLFRGFSTSLTGLMCTALAGGASIGMIQALMPALIKKNTRNRPARLCLCSARHYGRCGAGCRHRRAFVYPADLKPTLAIAGLLALLALIFWLSACQAPPGKNGVRRGDIIFVPDRVVIAVFWHRDRRLYAGTGVASSSLYSGGLAHAAAAICWPGLR